MLKKAAVIKYDKDNLEEAPKVVALGKGFMAEKIIEMAKENGVPLYEDIDVVDSLMELDINQEIPEDLYGVVAEILAYIYKLNKG